MPSQSLTLREAAERLGISVPALLRVALALAAHTKHGRRSKAHLAKVEYIHAELRRITNELEKGGFLW